MSPLIAQLNVAAERFKDLDTARLVSIILSLAQWFLALIGIIAVIMALWSAFLFITTGAESEEKRNKAKQTLTYAIIGVAVAAIAFSIVTITESVLSPPAAPAGPISCTRDADCPAGQSCVKDRFNRYICVSF